MHKILEEFLHSLIHVEVLSKVDSIHQNTSGGAVHFLNGLSTTIYLQLMPLFHHHYFANLIDLPYGKLHAIEKMDGIQCSDASRNLTPPLPSPDVPIDPLGSGVDGHNQVATLFKVPDNVLLQLIAAV